MSESDAPSPSPEPPASANRGPLWGALGILGIFLFKSKALLLLILTKAQFLLALFKFKTLLSMGVMIWFESLRFGPAFGVGFVILLLLHELGHYGMARYLGLDVSTPVFIPFVGAFISMKETPENVEIEAWVAIAGPILGSLAAALCLVFYALSQERLFLSLAYIGFFLNLFNLLPVRPLDGGRITGALSPWLWGAGLVFLLFLILTVFHSPLLILILVLGISEFYGWWKGENRAYFEISQAKRTQFAVGYFGLVALLTLGITSLYTQLGGVH
ncbi:site-2 protease family protein [bacterium (Candidatus Blackallbacteria) CG17_big_fil_post_rev_8_21_14_2_50_48_46]|uniref:Site-2 protease family protein n=1 Tax=bacterium (Candidatus Blackallbacteria) CG17_big_fil_post_rev_8_21_14_2_50_48_46 TaxID=2014261 RepID=A0A2M7G8T2_9BACT|nr:MAG: site-2 protease family protein [bacterium (Candidatus Blackallbacteria) CG18_big_fil_WC_8_21_14_2_50_49_26]PIW18509.1 MAG: site-2 protease family protein [bacterium (Candidatus Blackallbacteria) CG17_big_fil_post_rev_8_21_14_2_50_48_46]PIW46506.1 MAG: site-2 protease family protein [bacterium (Candidatus Blackallbacteria) CG13_big_fil_rev_8_21_14_2_50_49_14]